LIFVTGDTLGVENTAFLAHCGQPYLYKPCTAAEVRRAIQQVLGVVAVNGTEARVAGDRDTGETLPEDGTLSIVRRGAGYQVRYASNNPYAQERLPRVCPDEATVRALLHAVGTEAEAVEHACAVARKGGVAVLHVRLARAQMQACFRPAPAPRPGDALGDACHAAHTAHHP
jgi:hypothetical protein